MTDLLLQGLKVTLTTSAVKDPPNPGTDDNLYIGVVGTGGGREFPLASPDEDFESGTQTFILGTVWEGFQPPVSVPFGSKPGENNDPALVPLDMDSVNFVYLRKTGTLKGGDTYESGDKGDDAYRLQEASVALYGPPPSSKRLFTFSIPVLSPGTDPSVWIGSEFGLVIYLREPRKDAPAT
jgi:hypothetical protein